MNIFDFALKMEQSGKIYYEKLAKNAKVKGLQMIFTELAKDEQKHYEIIMALQVDRKVRMVETTVLEQSRDVFATLLADKSAKDVAQDDLEGYHYAMRLETESFHLYEDAAAKEKHPEAKALLLRIAAEEHKHFNILENIYAFVNAPDQYLAWVEFSNLGEFKNFGRDVGR